MEKARRAALNLQNPTKYTANSADCVSCHMAKQATPDHGPDPLDFKSYAFRLDRTSDRVGPFRMFGYDSNNNAIVTTRVVDETVVVLDYVNRVVMQ